MAWPTSTLATGDLVTAAQLNALVTPSAAFLACPTGSGSSSTNIGTNAAYFCRVVNPMGVFTVTKLNLYIGTSSGNIDVGIYTDSGGLPSARLWSRGGVASPGTSNRSILISAGSPSTLTLNPGTYWLAVAADNNTVQFAFSGTQLPVGLTASAASAYPLPATISSPAAQNVGPLLVLE